MLSFTVGIIAAFLTTISFLPQVIKIYKTKNTRDLSLWTFVIFLVGVCCWLLYGILIGEVPVIIANLMTMVLIIYIIIMKLRYG